MSADLPFPAFPLPVPAFPLPVDTGLEPLDEHLVVKAMIGFEHGRTACRFTACRSTACFPFPHSPRPFLSSFLVPGCVCRSSGSTGSSRRLRAANPPCPPGQTWWEARRWPSRIKRRWPCRILGKIITWASDGYPLPMYGRVCFLRAPQGVQAYCRQDCRIPVLNSLRISLMHR